MKIIISILLFLTSTLLVQAQSTSDKLIKAGAKLHDQGKYMDAISSYQQALKLSPTSMSAVYEMSLSYLKMKDYNNAIIHSTQVITTGFRPLLVDAYVVKGTALAAQDKLDEAITLFTQAIAQCGGEYLLHYNLGLSYYKKGNTKQALLNLRKALEKDTTQSGAFLLYAYALNDDDKWLQSFYSFHFFLLLEPNTKRSTDAFREMYHILDTKLDANSVRLGEEEGIVRRTLYNKIQSFKTTSTTKASQYTFFVESSKEIFTVMKQNKLPEDKGLLWEFFVPIFGELLESGHFDTYSRYVSVSYFPESLKWWETNKDQVDNFIEWFENGESPDAEEDAYFEGEE